MNKGKRDFWPVALKATGYFLQSVIKVPSNEEEAGVSDDLRKLWFRNVTSGVEKQECFYIMNTIRVAAEIAKKQGETVCGSSRGYNPLILWDDKIKMFIDILTKPD